MALATGLLRHLTTLCVFTWAGEAAIVEGSGQHYAAATELSHEGGRGPIVAEPRYGAGFPFARKPGATNKKKEQAPRERAPHEAPAAEHRPARRQEEAERPREATTEPPKTEVRKLAEAARAHVDGQHGAEEPLVEPADKHLEHEDVHLQSKHGGLHEHALAAHVVVPIGIAIIAALFLGGLLERYEISWFPESAVTIVVGMCLGFYMRSSIGYIPLFQHEEVFNTTCATLLTLFLLPILIFEAGWSLRTKDFASQFQYIMIFAVVGSLVSFLVVGTLIYVTGQPSVGLHSIQYARTAFAYASLIAATDPVSTLATYSKLKVDALLNIMVFGDSTFNDAVAIVLFKVLNNDAIMGTPDSRPTKLELTGHILGGILKIFIGSIVVGTICAIVFLLLVRLFHMRHAPRLECLALVAVGYVTFAVGEVVGMSGIIATVQCSIMVGIYGRPHLSPSGSILGTYFFKQLASLMDTSVFLLTGFCAVGLGRQGLWFGGWAILFCLLGRAAAVFPLGAVTNAIKRRIGRSTGTPEDNWHLLTPQALFMMWHAGLRGAICLTLCMQLGPWVDILDGPGTRHILQTATYLVICVFLLVFGGSTEACLTKLGIPMGEVSSPDTLYKTEAATGFRNFLKNIDKNYLVPLLVGNARLVESIKETDTDVNPEDVLRFGGYGSVRLSSPREDRSDKLFPGRGGRDV